MLKSLMQKWLFLEDLPHLAREALSELFDERIRWSGTCILGMCCVEIVVYIKAMIYDGVYFNEYSVLSIVSLLITGIVLQFVCPKIHFSQSFESQLTSFLIVFSRITIGLSITLQSAVNHSIIPYQRLVSVFLALTLQAPVFCIEISSIAVQLGLSFLNESSDTFSILAFVFALSSIVYYKYNISQQVFSLAIHAKEAVYWSSFLWTRLAHAYFISKFSLSTNSFSVSKFNRYAYQTLPGGDLSMAFQNTIIDLEQSQHSIESPPWKEDEKQIDFAQFLLAQHIQIHNKHSLNNQQSNSNHNLEASKEEEKLKNSTKSNQNYSPGRKRFGNKNRKKSLKKWNSGKYKQSSSQAQLSPGLSKKLSLETVLIATRNWEDCEAEKVIIRIFEGELPHELLIVIEEQPVHNPSYQNIKKRNKELTKLSQSNLHAFYQKFNIFQEAFLELKEQTQTQQDPFLKQVNDSLSCLLQESTILKNRLFCLEYYLQNIIRRNQIAKPKSDEINLEKMLVVLENFFPQIRIDNQSIDKVFYNDADKLMYLLISIISNACMCACRFPIRLIVSSTSNAELTLPPNLKRPSSRLSFKTIDIPTRQSDYTNIKRPSDSLFSHSQYNNHKVFDGKQRRIENRQKRLESRHSESAIYNFEEPHYARFQQQQQLSEDTHVEQVQEVDQTDDTPAVPGEVEYQRKQQQNLMDGIPNEKTEQKQHHLIGTFPSDLEEQKKEFLGNLLSDRDDHRRMPQASSSICSNNPQQSMNNTANNINNPNRWDGILFRISFMHEKGVALTNHYNCVEDTESLKIEQKIISRFIKTIGPQNSLLVKSAISLKETSEEREDLLKRTFKLTYDAYMEHFQKYYWMKKEGHFQQEEKRATMQKKEEELVSSDFEMIAYKDILQTTQPVLSLSKPRQSQASLKTLFPITRLKSDDLILRLKTGSSLIPSHFVDNHIQNNNSNIIFHGNMNQMSVNSQDKQGILEKKEEISSNEESQTEILPAISEEVQYGEITHGLPASLKINKNDQFPIKSFQNRSFQTKGYNQNHIERILDENPSISKQQEEEQLQIVFPISKKILEENNHLERPDSLISARDQLQHLNQTIQRYRTNSGFSDLIQYPKESEQLQSQQILDIGNVFNGYGFTSPTSGQELLGGRQQKQLTPRKKE